MLYREIMAACPEIHTKHINTLCEQNVELLNVKLVHIVTTVLLKVKRGQKFSFPYCDIKGHKELTSISPKL